MYSPVLPAPKTKMAPVIMRKVVASKQNRVLKELKERKVISRNPERVLKIVSPKIGMIKAKTTLIVLRKCSS